MESCTGSWWDFGEEDLTCHMEVLKQRMCHGQQVQVRWEIGAPSLCYEGLI